MLAVSRLNYPGADALNRLHVLAANDTGVVKVHMDTLACMTGVTRFLEKPPPVLSSVDDAAFWIYDKTEDEWRLLEPLFWEGFDYALAEKPERIIGRWEVLETVDGFAGVSVLRPGEEGDNVLGGTWVEAWVRRYITKGWWVGMKMEPRIRILRKERGALMEGVEGGRGEGSEGR